MNRWYKRLWAPALCFTTWLSALAYLPWDVAFPIMVVAAFCGGGSLIYVLTGFSLD